MNHNLELNLGEDMIIGLDVILDLDISSGLKRKLDQKRMKARLWSMKQS